MPNVLVVEDDQALRDVYVVILESARHEVEAAPNGKIALDMCGQNHYDLLLLDLKMPVMDGVTFLKQVCWDRYGRPKIIVFSNLPSGSAIDEVRHMGVDGQIVKSSLTPRDLIKKVDEILSPSCGAREPQKYSHR
jgi:CheY-like chemotaxis protein